MSLEARLEKLERIVAKVLTATATSLDFVVSMPLVPKQHREALKKAAEDMRKDADILAPKN